MATYTVTGPDEAEKLNQFKKIAKIMGYSVKTSTPAKKPRTKLQQEFVEAYQEVVAAERGEVELQNVEDFLKEIREEKKAGYAN